MKSNFFYTIVLASIAAVCAAPADMSEMNPLSSSSQSLQVVAMEQGVPSSVKPSSVMNPTSLDSQVPVVNSGAVTTSSTPMVKTAAQTVDFPDEGYTTFLITSPTKADTLVKGTT